MCIYDRLIMKLGLLRFVYRGILTGMPLFTYNPITKTPIHVPFTISPHSTYINYELSPSQTHVLNKYIQEYDPAMEITPIQMLSYETDPVPYLSINVYNCSSPIFFNDNQEITRLEINTYIRKWNEQSHEYDYGTVILDYTSNALSMDPIHLFKSKEHVRFVFPDEKKAPVFIDSKCVKDDIFFRSSFTPSYFISRDKKKNEDKLRLHEDLIRYSDAIYYKNGIYDKLYYDSSLVKANIKIPITIFHTEFVYRDLLLEKPKHVFYFEDSISFVGGMWENVFSNQSQSSIN
jgi:hypothetical protein